MHSEEVTLGVVRSTSDENNTPDNVDNPREQVGFANRASSMVMDCETGYTSLNDNDADRYTDLQRHSDGYEDIVDSITQEYDDTGYTYPWRDSQQYEETVDSITQ